MISASKLLFILSFFYLVEENAFIALEEELQSQEKPKLLQNQTDYT